METTTNKNIKTLSFFELMSGNSRIEIPIIQRDYAQGREKATDIRNGFLKTIKNHLDEEKPLNLDFIYGSIEDNKFIPIDGQQRLTTLFLLHWYLAWASEDQENSRTFLGIFDSVDKTSSNNAESPSRFTYETRISSRDFCNLLVSKQLDINTSEKISDHLKNQPWFYLNWKHDATIVSMLNTLDSIQEIFTEPEKYYGLLTKNDLQLISFQFIELKNFGLTDQLYIKMNSRGKPLTEFENLKANIEQIFEDYDKEKGTSHTAWLTSNIDGYWTDLFWSFLSDKSNLVDSLFINYIRASITNFYALDDSCNEDKLKSLLDSKKKFSYFMLDSLGFAEFEPLYNCFLHLDKLQKNGAFQEFINKPEIINEKDLFGDIIKDNTSYQKRIQFFALYEYLHLDRDMENLPDWMRVVRNLTENSRIEDPEEYQTALKTVEKLLSKIDNIREILMNRDSGYLTGFSNYQSSEEIVKAKLIFNNPEWKGRIETAEDHPYLKGHIGFLLEFSGITKAITGSSTSVIDKKEDAILIDSFNTYSKKFNALFKEDGIKDYDEFLFERALLSIGDYLLMKGRNHSFLINGNDREISWKRLFRSDNRVLLKDLFDQVDINDIEDNLESLIENYEIDEDEDWPYFFIKYPEILSTTGKNKFIRWYSNDNILLLEKTQLNGMHREYWTFAIYCELKEKGYDVEYHPDAIEDYDSKYISSINGKEIFITYFPDGDYEGYWIESDLVEGGEIKLENHDEVIEYIENLIPQK
jgi:hypothetical protein